MSVLREVEALPQQPNPNSVAIMEAVDAMPKQFRDLIREYGFAIVMNMVDDGATDYENLARDLRSWRRRRQAEYAK